MTNTETGTPGASDNTMPPTAEISAKTTDATIVGDGRDEYPRRRGGGCDQQRHHQQRADDLHALRGGDADQRREHDAQRADRYPARGSHLRVDGGEQQRPVADGQHRRSRRTVTTASSASPE